MHGFDFFLKKLKIFEKFAFEKKKLRIEKESKIGVLF